MEKEIIIKLLLCMYRIMISETIDESEEVYKEVKQRLTDKYINRISFRCMDKMKTLLTMTLSITRTSIKDKERREN